MSLSQWLNSPYFSFVLIVIALVLLLIALLILVWTEFVKVDQKEAFSVTTKRGSTYTFGPVTNEGIRTVTYSGGILPFKSCSNIRSLSKTQKVIEGRAVKGYNLIIIYPRNGSYAFQTEEIVRIQRA